MAPHPLGNFGWYSIDDVYRNLEGQAIMVMHSFLFQIPSPAYYHNDQYYEHFPTSGVVHGLYLHVVWTLIGFGQGMSLELMKLSRRPCNDQGTSPGKPRTRVLDLENAMGGRS